MQLVLDPASEQAAVDSFEQFRVELIKNVREGMQEAMTALAYNVVDKLSGDPITSRSGALAGTILGSPKTTVSGDLVRGSISSDVGNLHLGLWLEFGIHVREVVGKLFPFYEADGIHFARGHKAFDVKGKPFLNPSLEESQSSIMQTIAEHIGANAVVSA